MENRNNHGRFVYVLCDEGRKALLKLGLRMVRDDGTQKIYVFENDPHVNLDEAGVDYVISDVLTF